MAVKEIKKVFLIGLKKYQDEVMERLQLLGNSQIETLSDESSETTESKNELLDKVQFCLKFLKPLAPPKGILESLEENVEIRNFEWLKDLAENFDIDKIHANLKDFDQQLKSLAKKEDEINTKINTYDKYRLFNSDLSIINGLIRTKHAFGSLEVKAYSELEEKLQELYCFWKPLSRSGKNVNIYISYHKDNSKEIQDLFTQYGVIVDNITEEKGLIEDILLASEKELEKIEQQKNDIIEAATVYTTEIEKLETLYDYYYSLKIRGVEGTKLKNTEYTFFLKLFVPTSDIEIFKKEMLDISDSIEIIIEDPAEDEKVPIILENRNIVKPVETVTTLYGYPNSREFDPTPILGGFFIFFFAVCLTDAAYGVILALLSFTLMKSLKMRGGMKRLFTLLVYSGIVTFFVGALAGGWLGFTPSELPKAFQFVKKFQIIDPASQALQFLIWALVIGVIQLVFGNLVRAVMHFKRGDYVAVIFDDVVWAIYLSAITIYLFTKDDLVKNIILVCVAIIVLTGGRSYKAKNFFLNIIAKLGGGILSLYGTMGYLGDVLSYSRLMALGLATGGIAMVINLLAKMLGDAIPVVGILFAIIFMALGHTVNVILNALGAFIHSARLQYVEFYPKFFEGGGKPFRPFSFRLRKVIINKNKKQD